MKMSVIGFLAAVAAGCHGFESMKAALLRPSPYERYVQSLQEAGLLKTAMATEWIAAGQRAFNDSIFVDAPYSESGYFSAAVPEARSYRFKVHEGQVLHIKSETKSDGDARLFIDLFFRDGMGWEPFLTIDSAANFTHEFTSDEDCVLRLQPELLSSMFYMINISITPALPNPVYGASNRSIGSYYGDPRDHGKRRHKGVDIFAVKGTPVLAPADGEITRVELTKLGGKVVWMRDRKRHHSYYFAHLDSQLVKPGMRVFEGYVLGLVGKTGNARHTPPHLHFGIYDRGAKDPLYFIRQVRPARAPGELDTTFRRQPLRIRSRRVPVMAGPSTHVVKTFLSRQTYVVAVAESGKWYRISLPDGSEGYVVKRSTAALSSGTLMRLDSARTLLANAGPDAIPVTTLPPDSRVEVLARFKDYRFVRTSGGTSGWLCLN